MRSSRRRPRFSRSSILAAALVLLGLSGGGWYWYRQGDEPPLRRSGDQTADVPPMLALGAATADEVPDDAPFVSGPLEVADEHTLLTPAAKPVSEDDPGLGAPDEVLSPQASVTQAGDFPPRSLTPVRAADGAPAGETPPTGQGAGGAQPPVSAANPPRTPTTMSAAAPPPAQPSASGPVAAARRLYESGKPVEARHELNRLLSASASGAEQSEIRGLLVRIADETIFSPKQIPNDPLVELYAVKPGDALVNVGRQFAVPSEIIMQINDITDPRRLRAGEKLKIPRGPFHVRISKSEFRMDVYLQDLFVRSYRVGLGADKGTPEGTWRVKERLPNPTYYPPASASEKRIIHANDPKNPLGEHWIGLEGVSGNAVGHDGYGIHGTIEPDSIGRAASLGCVRMLNEDVAAVYAMLIPGKSTVEIRP